MTIPFRERLRVQALRKTGVLDADGEKAFGDLVTLAISLTHSPICAITFIDLERQWCKAAVGLTLCAAAREDSFCDKVILSGEPIVVPDMQSDHRFNQHSLVVGSPFVRSYAGFPIIIENQYVIGTLCLLDFQPRVFRDEEVRAMQTLANIIAERLESQVRFNQMEMAIRYAPSMICSVSMRPGGEAVYTYASPGASDLLEIPIDEIIGANSQAVFTIHEDDVQRINTLRASATHKDVIDCEFRVYLRNGKMKWIRSHFHQTEIVDGNVLLDGTMTDVTVYKKVDELAALRAAEKRESDNLRTIATLASAVAHEIKNPLAIIQALHEELADKLRTSGGLSESDARDFEAIQDSISRITKAVNSMSFGMIKDAA